MHGKSDAATYEKYMRLIHVKHILFKAFSRAFDQLQPADDLVEQINPYLCHEIRTPVGWWPHTVDMRVRFFCVKFKQTGRRRGHKIWPQNVCFVVHKQLKMLHSRVCRCTIYIWLFSFFF